MGFKARIKIEKWARPTPPLQCARLKSSVSASSIDVVEVAVELSISVFLMEVGSSGSSLSPNWVSSAKEKIEIY